MSLENNSKKCPQCGKMNNAENKFCSHCFSLIDENFDSDSITIELKKNKKVSNGSPDDENEKSEKTLEETIERTEPEISKTDKNTESEDEKTESEDEKTESEDEKTESEDEKTESEDEKAKINKQKVFAEFFKQYKENEYVRDKFDLELSLLNNWCTNDQWVKKADGLIKLKERRDNVLYELLQLDWYNTSKDEAIDFVSKKLRIGKSKIEQWYEKHDWEAEIQSKQDRLEKIKEEKRLKIQAEKEEKQREKQLLEEKYLEALKEENKKLDLFEEKIKEYLNIEENDIILRKENNLACLINKISDEKRLYTFGIKESEFIQKLTLRYQINKDIHGNLSKRNSNFRLDGNKVILKLNIKYIEENTHFNPQESHKFQFLSSEFNLEESINRKAHEKYYYDLELGDYTDEKFFNNILKLFDIVEFSPKTIKNPEKFSHIESINLSDEFSEKVKQEKLNEMESKKEEVREYLADLKSSYEKDEKEITADYAITSAYRKYNIPKKVIKNWYETEWIDSLGFE